MQAGDLVVVLEAMKMEQPLTAHRAGTVTKPHRAGRRDGDQRLDLCAIIDACPQPVA